MQHNRTCHVVTLLFISVEAAEGSRYKLNSKDILVAHLLA